MKENFSNNQFDSFGRATIVPSMTKSGRGGKITGSKKRRKRSNKGKTNSGVKLIKGRVVLRVPGYQGVQRLTPSHLIQHINKKNLRVAAKNVLKRANKNIKKRRKRRTKKKKH